MTIVPDLAGKGEKKKNRHGKKWPHTLRSPPGQLAADPAGLAHDERLLLLRNATAAEPLLDICTC